jgi:predicted signal transduction protein with EAL and GGDEF domain
VSQGSINDVLFFDTRYDSDRSVTADLKIDSAFTRDIDQNSAHQTLVKTLCEIGHSIGVTMIAGGVRDDAECNTLRKLGRWCYRTRVNTREPQES